MKDFSARRAVTRDLLNANRIIPVITIENEADAAPLARALVAGGITALEITLRTKAARAAVRKIITEVPEARVGIGTVLNAEDLNFAREVGAKFALSPGASPALLKAAAGVDIPFIPGIATASELMAALDHGFDAVKFFPAMAAGGIPALKALAGPFPDVVFCPTGGITEANARDWLAVPNVRAVGGSWLSPPALIRAGDWAAITALAKAATLL